MAFTTSTFLFCFLPLTLILYYWLSKCGNRMEIGNVIIAIGSFIFYSWALATSAVMLLLYAVIIYFIGQMISLSVQGSTELAIPFYSSGERKSKFIKIAPILLLIGVVMVVYELYHFKYASTVAPMLSGFFYVNKDKYSDIIVPLGISFITFSAISYFIDIYRKDADPGTFLDCFIYIFFFPKVVSGPIVLWKNFQPQLNKRAVSSDGFVNSINRVIIGFAKKVILADTFGLYASKIESTPIDIPTAWFGWILYAMQIYYDFSGYSDIAIGLAEMLGFSFPENFNFPYRSLSISEFWRRWHISLGTFFREYIYIPLGGNRKGKNRTLLNLGAVFLVTGIWHGVGLAYIIWGCIHGVCVIIERVIRDRSWYRKIPGFIKWAITFFITACAWQLFRYGDFFKALASLTHLIGIHSYENKEIIYNFAFYADNEVVFLLIIGIIGATILGSPKIINMYEKLKKNTVFYGMQEIILILLLILSIAYMISSGYSPFIYFQF